MIKYFSQILSKFSVKQRMTALIILCVVLIIVTLGSLLIKTLDPSTKELKIRIDNQDNEIKRLNSNMDSANSQIYSLNQTIIKNQRECTNQIVQREQEITKMIDDIINKKLSTKKYTSPIVKSSPKMMTKDSTPRVAMEMYIPPTNNIDNSINDLLELKKKIKKH